MADLLSLSLSLYIYIYIYIYIASALYCYLNEIEIKTQHGHHLPNADSINVYINRKLKKGYKNSLYHYMMTIRVTR